MPCGRYMPCRPTGQPGSDDSDINTLTEAPCAGVEEAGQALQPALLWTESTFCSLAQESVELEHSNIAPPWEKLLLRAFLKHVQTMYFSGTAHAPGGVPGNSLATALCLAGREGGGSLLPVDLGLTVAMEDNG